MNNTDKLTTFQLVRRPTGALETIASGKKRILSGMVMDTLALAKNEQATKSVVSVAMCGWAEPHFQQIVEMMLRQALPTQYSTQFEFFLWTTDLIEAARYSRFDLFILWLNPGSYSRKNTAERPRGRETNWDDHGDEVNSYELIASLRREFKKPVIAISNCVKYQSETELENAGAETVFWMPFGIDEFLSALTKCLKISLQTRSGAGTLPVITDTDLESWYQTGDNHYFGKSVPQDYTEAARWYRKAAEHGHTKAQNILGVCCDDGVGVPKDQIEAMNWYHKAAQQNYASAQTNLGYHYQLGEGVTRDEKVAVTWFIKAAKQNNAEAQYALAACYHDGNGVAKDDSEAVHWYRRAAEQGHAGAQFFLGVCYSKGQGVKQDDVEAIKWYQRAAELGNVAALNNLGTFYYEGRGLPKNIVESYRFYKLAAEHNNDLSATNLKRIVAEMTAFEIVEGERRIHEFRAKNQRSKNESNHLHQS